MEQYSPEWYEIRKGKLTSSEIYVLLSEPKLKADKDAGELSDTALTYILGRIGELMGSESTEFNTQATVWGTEQEPKARAWYSKLIAPVTEVGFITHPDFPFWGGSPDGIVLIDGVKGGVEIKCPHVTANHLQHCLIDSQEYFKKYFKQYYWQCVSNMLVTGSKFWDFVSFDPRLESDCGMFRFRVGYDEEDARQLIAAVVKSRTKMIEIAKKFNLEIQ